jgi:hypothetical protein
LYLQIFSSGACAGDNLRAPFRMTQNGVAAPRLRFKAGNYYDED